MSLINCHVIDDERNVLEDIQELLVAKLNSDIPSKPSVTVAGCDDKTPIKIIPHYIENPNDIDGMMFPNAQMVISDLTLTKDPNDFSGMKVLESIPPSSGIYRILLTGREPDVVLEAIAGRTLPFDMIMRKKMIASGRTDLICSKIDNLLRQRVSDMLLNLSQSSRLDLERRLHEKIQDSLKQVLINFSAAGTYEVEQVWYEPVDELLSTICVPEEQMSRREFFKLVAPAAWIRDKVEKLRTVAAKIPSLAEHFESVFQALSTHPEELSKLKELVDMAASYEKVLSTVQIARTNIIAWNRLFWGEMRTLLSTRLIVDSSLANARIYAGDLLYPVGETSQLGSAVIRFNLPGSYRIRVERFNGELAFDRTMLLHRGENHLQLNA